MNPDKLNSWLGLIANFGVIAGIAFVALELRQNTTMMQAQVRQGITENTINWQLAVGTDQDAAKAYMAGLSGAIQAQEGSESELMRILMTQANFRIWENEWYQFQKGLFEEEEMEARKNTWLRSILRSPGYRSHWQDNSQTYSREFQDVINELMAQIEN